MTEELKQRLECLAKWHIDNSNDALLNGSPMTRAFHASAATDIRAAIVSADDATKNMLTLRAWKANQRKYEQDPVSITGFDQLEGQS